MESLTEMLSETAGQVMRILDEGSLQLRRLVAGLVDVLGNSWKKIMSFFDSERNKIGVVGEDPGSVSGTAGKAKLADMFPNSIADETLWSGFLESVEVPAGGIMRPAEESSL